MERIWKRAPLDLTSWIARTSPSFFTSSTRSATMPLSTIFSDDRSRGLKVRRITQAACMADPSVEPVGEPAVARSVLAGQIVRHAIFEIAVGAGALAVAALEAAFGVDRTPGRARRAQGDHRRPFHRIRVDDGRPARRQHDRLTRIRGEARFRDAGAADRAVLDVD